MLPCPAVRSLLGHPVFVPHSQSCIAYRRSPSGLVTWKRTSRGKLSSNKSLNINIHIDIYSYICVLWIYIYVFTVWLKWFCSRISNETLYPCSFTIFIPTNCYLSAWTTSTKEYTITYEYTKSTFCRSNLLMVTISENKTHLRSNDNRYRIRACTQPKDIWK